MVAQRRHLSRGPLDNHERRAPRLPAAVSTGRARSSRPTRAGCTTSPAPLHQPFARHADSNRRARSSSTPPNSMRTDTARSLCDSPATTVAGCQRRAGRDVRVGCREAHRTALVPLVRNRAAAPGPRRWRKGGRRCASSSNHHCRSCRVWSSLELRPPKTRRRRAYVITFGYRGRPLGCSRDLSNP